MKEKMEKKTHVSEGKKKSVKELGELIKNSKTIMIASVKNLPSAKFQEISKKLRGKAVIKVPKKNLIFKALDSSGNETVKQLKEQIKDSVAILFSDMDAFELAVELIKNKSPTKAKVGQEAVEDIEVQAGPTDLIPGPAISELGALGIQIQIDKGKINIKESKVIVKKGQKISSSAADVMSKLDIKPFSVGFIPLCAFDIKENKIYYGIKIDRDETLKEMKTTYSKALALGVQIGYATEETIKFIIGKAGMHEKALKKLINSSEHVQQNKTMEEEK
jgi:large subunit ribosomal protein L10